MPFELFTATQVSASELQDVFQETSSNIFQINANGKYLKFNFTIENLAYVSLSIA